VIADASGVTATSHVGGDRPRFAASIGTTGSLHLPQPLDLAVGFLKGLGVGEGLTPAEREVA
jgi:hypothetical protein